jgi:molybdate transport system substrate-binding protein
MNRIVATAVVALTLVVGPPALGNAAEIHVWTARAIATVLAEIGPEFERRTGHHLNVYSGLPDDFQRRANAGDPCDVIVSGSAPVARWIKEGRLVAETRTDIARSGVGVAVRSGARKPDVRSVEAFTQSLLDAKSIAYLRVGSGLHVADVLERLGIAETIKSKITRPESDIVSEPTPGVELVGPLPPEIQSYVVFAGAVATNSRAPEAAQELMKFLTGATAAPVIRAQGMEPAL